MYQYGIYANNCNEVYVGRHNGVIHKFFFDGTNFILQDSIVIAGHQNASVYDIVYNPIHNQFMVSGEGFVASVHTQSTCSNGSQSNIQLSYTIYCPDSAAVSVTNGAPGESYTFTWFDSTTNTSLSNTSPGLGIFTHGLSGLITGNKIQVSVTKASACQYFSNDTSFILTCNFDTTVFRYSCPGDTIHIGPQIVSVPGFYIDTFTNALNQDSIVATHYAHYPTYNFTEQISICRGTSYTLPNNNQVSTAGTYTSTFISSDGCDSIITTVLTITEPVPTTVYATICSTNSYTLPSNISTNIAGVYTDTLQAPSGCDSIIITNLEVIEQPSLYLGNDTIVCKNRPIILDATTSGAQSYTWQDLSTQGTFQVTEEGTYFAIASYPPCSPVSDTIHISKCACNIYIPNAFTPNDDQRNDVFTPYLQCNLPILDYEFKVFNRWGQLVFSTRDQSKGWDGTLKGEAQPIGSYFYTVIYLNPETTERDLFKGDITLIR